MFPGVTTGNALADGREFEQWFIGDLRVWRDQAESRFEASRYGLRNTSALEIKWGVHNKGEARAAGWAPGSSKVTLSILIRGEFLLKFRLEADRSQVQTIALSSESDYAVWGENVEHTWEAIVDSVVLTVRWPAESNRQNE
jgi:hypothetical protein